MKICDPDFGKKQKIKPHGPTSNRKNPQQGHKLPGLPCLLTLIPPPPPHHSVVTEDKSNSRQLMLEQDTNVFNAFRKKKYILCIPG